MHDSVTLIKLPPPLSTNALYHNDARVGRRKTKRHREWHSEAMWMITTQRVKPIIGPFEITIQVSRNHRNDIDNNCKCVLDVLGPAAGRVTEDDRKCTRLTVERADIEGCIVKIKPA